jgi:DNA polymerase I
VTVDISKFIGRKPENVKEEIKAVKRATKKVEKAVEKLEQKIYRTYEDYDIEHLMTYAGVDCIGTSELLSKLAPVCSLEPKYIRSLDGGRKKEVGHAMSIFDSYDTYTTPAFEFLCDLELNGIMYDVAGNRAMAARMVKEVGELEEQIYSALGKTKDQLNLDSGDAMVKLLYEEHGFDVESRTKTGEPSTDGDAINALADRYELGWLKLIAKRKDIVSIYRTFIENYVQDFVKPDGRIHSSYNQHGTSSFRISGENPNFTQIPRPKHGYNIRDLFVPSPGHVFIALDFSSAEVKVLGAISRDPGLLRAIAEGLDFHSFSASQMMGVSYEDFMAVINDGPNKATGYKGHPKFKEYKERRQAAKVLTFSLLYGSTAGGIAMQLNITKGEAEGLMDLYFSKFPKILEYITDMHNEAKWNHFVVGPFGQRKMQYGTLPAFTGTAVYNGALRNAQNVRIQGPTSSLGLACFAAGNEAIKLVGGRSLATVYDSWELECPIERAAEVVETAFYYMDEWPLERFDWLTLPIGVECEISGKSWGQCQVVHRGVTQGEIEAIIAAEKVK